MIILPMSGIQSCPRPNNKTKVKIRRPMDVNNYCEFRMSRDSV